MKISSSIDIDAPVERVWEIIGPGFADVARWASAVETSRPSGVPGPGEAPCDGRVCTVTATGFDHLTETLTHYDPAARSLTYRATRGMPRFVTLATNTWQVKPKPAGGCTFTMHATVHLAGIGRAAAPLLRGYLLRLGRRTAGDLKTYAENGRVGDAKAAQLRSAATTPLDRLVTVNAAFSAASGAVLTIGAGYWSDQLGEPGTAPITWIGTGLLAYAAELAWLSGRGVTRSVGRTIASLDAAWVIGTVVLVATVGASFTTVGILAAGLAGVVVAGLGWRQWRAVRHTNGRSTQASYSSVDSLAARSRR